jgi:hypothetical protein
MFPPLFIVSSKVRARPLLPTLPHDSSDIIGIIMKEKAAHSQLGLHFVRASVAPGIRTGGRCGSAAVD